MSVAHERAGTLLHSDVHEQPLGQLGAADQNPHFTRAVARVGEENAVIAQQDIYTENGTKLLAKGARINQSTHLHLIAHKLELPLDMVLCVADSVDQVSLVRDMDRIISADPILRNITMRSGDPQGYKSILGTLTIPAPLLFRLTVMRDDRNDLYLHSLRTAVIAHSLGVRIGLSQETLENLFLASICHDFGEMHTDPTILSKGRAIHGSERRFVHVHPITGYAILSQIENMAPGVLQGVLQHHERLDGSGYPSALTEERICTEARIIAVAETVETIARRARKRQIRIAIRLNTGRLDTRYLSVADELLQTKEEIEPALNQNVDVTGKLARLTAVFGAWPALQEKIKHHQQSIALDFIGRRVQSIQSLAMQAGLSTDLLECLDLTGDDATVLPELNVALVEMDRVIDELIFEVERRTSHLPHCAPILEHIRKTFETPSVSTPVVRHAG